MKGFEIEISVDGLDIHDEPLWKIVSDMRNNYYNELAVKEHTDDFDKVLDSIKAWYPEKEAYVRTFIEQCLDNEYHKAEQELDGSQVLLYNIKRDLLSHGYDSNYKGESYKLSDSYDVDIEYVPSEHKFTIDVTGTDEEGNSHEYVSAIPEEELLGMDYKAMMSYIGEVMNTTDWEEES